MSERSLASHWCWNGIQNLLSVEDGQCIGRLPDRIYQVMRTLSSSADIQFEVFVQRISSTLSDKCSVSEETEAASSSGPANAAKDVSVILYGPMNEALGVGDWLGQCDLFLQCPRDCARDVPYKNPQCLSFDDAKITLTSDLVDDSWAEPDMDEDLFNHLTELDNHDTLEEAGQPALIKTPLRRHQKQALTFLTQREDGWDLESGRTDVWKSFTDHNGRIRYRNTICGSSQLDPPPDFRGGCLADSMGLGKTLSMLSLIAAKPAVASAGTSVSRGIPVNRVKATLIIVPASLVQVWDIQIKRHFYPSAVSVLIYHGSQRRRFLSRLVDFG